MGTQTGTSANDTLTGGGGDDVAFGGAGNDTVYGGDGDDLSYGGTGNDALYGGTGNDANAGEKGDDAMYGGAGRDTLVGGQGHDTMYGGSDNDTMLGDGQWLNLAEYASGSGGKATNLTLTNSADGPIDLYQINGSGNSVYVATIQPGQTLVQSTTTTTNWILRDPDGYYLEPITGASNQTVNYGPDLSDTMYGGTGDDHIRSQYGNDMVYGDDGNDSVRAGYGHDVVYGGIGNDTLYGDAGNDTIYGDAGNDTAYGGTGDDKIGSHGADSAGNDTLYGGDGNDSLIGGGENDVLYGDAGNDTLAGGVGADTLYGGADADTFAVTEDHQTDTIYGGETGNDNDAIVLTNYVTTQGVNVAFTGSEAGTYSYYGGGDRAVLPGSRRSGRPPTTTPSTPARQAVRRRLGPGRAMIPSPAAAAPI